MKQCHLNTLNCIKEYIQKNGFSPSIRDIVKNCGYKSTSTVFNHLKILEEKGLISIARQKRRAIRVIG